MGLRCWLRPGGCLSKHLFIALLLSSLSYAGGGDLRTADRHYSDANKSLFVMPASAAMASSDNSFSAQGAVRSNPSVLATRSGSELSLSYAGFYHNVFSVSNLSYSTKVDDRHGIALSLAYLHIPNILITDDLETTSDGTPIFKERYGHASEVFARVSWGMEVPRIGPFSPGIGAAVNGQRKNLVGLQGYGIGVDVGGYVDIAESGVRLTLDLENLTTNYTRWLHEDRDGALDFSSRHVSTALPHARLGIGFQKDLPYVYGRVRLSYLSMDFLANEGVNATRPSPADSTAETRELDLSDVPRQIHPSESPALFFINGRFGAEYLISDRVAIRVGTSQENRFTFGAGISFLKQRMTVDFAYLLHELAGTYQVAGVYRW